MYAFAHQRSLSASNAYDQVIYGGIMHALYAKFRQFLRLLYGFVNRYIILQLPPWPFSPPKASLFNRRFVLSLALLFLLLVLIVTSIYVVLPGHHLNITLPTRHVSLTSQKLASLKGLGSIPSAMVGPGTTAGSQKYYIGYQYEYFPLDFVAIDPNNNDVAMRYTSPVSTEYAAAAMAVGPDNNMYIGTKSTVNSHILKFNTSASQLSDVGTVPVDPTTSVKQTYIWQFTLSPINQRIYGCTYPSADLISYGPNDPTPQILNLGTVDPSNQYAHSCAADQTNPYIYMGTGSVTSKIVAYNIQTKATSVLVTGPSSGFGDIWVGSDNNVYGSIGNQYYLLSNGTAKAVNSPAYHAPTNVFSNGDRITFNTNYTNVITTHSNGTQNIYPYTYQGNNIKIFRIGIGPDSNIYAGSILPFYLTKFIPGNPASGLINLGPIAAGEPYSMLSYNGKLEIATYTSPALMSYDPTTPISPNPYVSPNCGATTNAPNPQCLNVINNWSSSGGVAGDLRPEALIAAPDGNLYTGSVAHFGQLNGPLVKWNVQTGTASAYYPFSNLGVGSLAVANACQGVTSTAFCLIGGTTTFGGVGATPTATTSPLFIWDPAANAMVSNFTIPNAPKVSKITDLITNPKNNYVYGIAMSSSGNYLFIFNPKTGTFVNGGTPFPFSPIYNSVDIGSDGNIWGVAATGIFRINLTTNTAQLVSLSPQPITAGFVLVKDPTNGDTIYFGSNADLYMFSVPDASTSTPTNTPGVTPTPTPTPTKTPGVTPTPTPSPTVRVTPTPIIVQDTFQRQNQTEWGLASDKVNTWGADAKTNPVFSIVNNTGRVSNGNASYNAVLGSAATNAQVLFSGSISSFSNANLGSVVRWSDTNNWYKAYIDGKKLVIQKDVRGTITTLKSLSFPATAGTSYSLRFQVVGTTLSAKVWATKSTEPANWMLSVTDGTFASGFCGLQILLSKGITATYTSFIATSL